MMTMSQSVMEIGPDQIRVIEQIKDEDLMVYFHWVNEETELVERSVAISYKDWVEFGKPTTITNTIELGDVLNG